MVTANERIKAKMTKLEEAIGNLKQGCGTVCRGPCSGCWTDEAIKALNRELEVEKECLAHLNCEESCRFWNFHIGAGCVFEGDDDDE